MRSRRRTHGRPQRRGLLRKARRKTLEARRLVRHRLRLHHPLVLRGHRRLDNPIHDPLLHGAHRARRAGQKRRGLQRIRLKQRRGRILSGALHGHHRGARPARSQKRNREKLQDNDADALHSDARPHRPRGHSAGRDEGNRVLPLSGLLQSDGADRARRARTGLLLALARRGRDTHLRQLPAEDGEHHKIRAADMPHRHVSGVPRGAHGVPRRIRLQRAARSGPRTHLHHAAGALRADARRYDILRDILHRCQDRWI